MRIPRLLRLLKSPYGALAILYIIMGITARFFPLVGDLHYEFSALCALITSLLTGALMIFRPRVRPAEEDANPLLHGGIFPEQLWHDIVTAAALSLIPLAIALIASLFGHACGVWEGTIWYLLLVPPAAVISVVLGALAETLTRRRWLAALLFLAIWLGSMARGAYEALTGPHIFIYCWQVGFFPGGSWDAELPVTPLLVCYRAAHLVIASLLALVVIELGRIIRRECDRPRAPVIAAAAVAAIAAAALLPQRPELGLTRTDRWLSEALGDSIRTRHATIYYSASGTDSLDLWRAANLTDFYVMEHARAIGIPADSIEPVIFYLYPTAAEQKRMVGTASAAFTKPWKRTLNMSTAAMESGLRHEVAHVILAPFGNPLGISFSQGMLEGSAMALENDYNWRTLHQYAAALYKYNLAPSPAEIMGIGGFSSRRSSVSYVLSGSFSKWLIESYGMPRYLKAFPWGDFDEAYGRSLDKLSEEYRGFIDSLDRPATPDPDSFVPHIEMDRIVEERTARYLFGGGSFFFQKCLRRIGTLNARGFEAIGEARYEVALERFRASLDEGINYGARAGIIQSLGGLGRYRELLDSTAAYALDTASYPLLPYTIEQGDAHWALGDRVMARELYESMVRLDISRELSTRALLRLHFLRSNDTLREIMRGYFTRPARTMQRMLLLDEALTKATTPANRMILLLMRATLVADASPRLAVGSLATIILLPTFHDYSDDGRNFEMFWDGGDYLERQLITSLMARLRDAATYVARLDGNREEMVAAQFVLTIGVEREMPYGGFPFGHRIGATEYLDERAAEAKRFSDYLNSNRVMKR